MRFHKPLPTLKVVLSEVSYDPETGLFMRVASPLVGKVAGHIQHNRRKIQINGKCYFASRLAWLIQTGEDPGQWEIDHADNDSLNDRWANLRLATTQDNSNNRRQWRRLENLPKGVHRQGSRFVGRIRVNYKLRHLGTFDTPEEAHAAYCAAARLAYGDAFWKPE